MNWRAVLTWTALSIVAWFLLVALLGLAAGFVIQQAYGLQDIPLAQPAMLIPIVLTLGILPRLALGFLLATTIWSFLARLIPFLEGAGVRLAAFLSLYGLVIGALVWIAIPLERSIAIYGALLFAASLGLPRYFSGRLPAGVFAGK